MGSRRRLKKLKEESQAVYGIQNESELLLLDTHIWVWYVFEDRRLASSKLISIIDDAETEGRLRLSPISVWEVGLIVRKGKLHLGVECLEWVKSALHKTNMILAPITPEIAIDSTHLPGNFHGDPADRIIVATARSINATLMTRDERILKYGRERYVKVVEA